jgi:hypothetical protein
MNGPTIKIVATTLPMWKPAILPRDIFPLLVHLLLFALVFHLPVNAADLPLDDSLPLRLPAVGDHQLRLLSPSLLELLLITTKPPDPATVTQWNFVGANGNLALPAPSQFLVTTNGHAVAVQSVGFKRRVLYAPLKQRDLRIGNYLYLQLAQPITNSSLVRVQNPSTTLWTTNVLFTLTVDSLRYSPAIHVNQVGYLPALPKKAMVGCYLGSFGELNVSASLGFQIVSTQTSNTVYTGTLVPRRDNGYTYTPKPYQQVLEADFSSFQTPGEYRLVVPGLGASLPFLIDDGIAATFARTYELGIYHQRCGTNNALPYTRFTHGACHTNLAQVPTMASPEFDVVNYILNQESMGALGNPRHTAPRMTNVMASLYPFVNPGPVDVSGGHHDAGDYSKYTINVAALVHYLMFAVDAFPGVKNLDNLGIPESGDGISDLLQEARWEADFLCKMQDADGGFYFIVYPKNRQYESNVLPDHGDPQVVLPKNTAGTAAAVAALAETASSPTFKALYPATASNYLAQAQAGWNFLQAAIAKYGRDGSYQTISSYGDTFMHDDELAWAAAALFAATGNPAYDTDLRTNTPNPNDPNLRRWGWWSMFGGYGCAFRTYAFAARTGRLQTNQLNASYLAKCEAEIKTAATNALKYSADHAYGSSFSDENKPIRTAGWYFSGDQTFDPAVAYLIDPQPAYLDIILKNFNYELGCNPLNISFLTGVGWKRQREIVHQYAQNDYRVLPPSGIPLGNIEQQFYVVDTYGGELGALTFPSDDANNAPYPMYDRWADAFNVMTEFVVSQQSGRSVATAAWLMTMTNVKTQAWRSASAQITGLPAQRPVDQPVTNNLLVPGLDLSQARIVWEALGQEPCLGRTFTFTPANIGINWVEVEAQWPDGRRVVAATNFFATLAGPISSPLLTNADMVALYHLTTNFSDATLRQTNLTVAGTAALDLIGLHVQGPGDQVSVNLPNSALYIPNETQAISIEARLYINNYKPLGAGGVTLLSLIKAWNIQLTMSQDTWRTQPDIVGGSQIILPGATLSSTLTLGQWHLVNLTLNKAGYTVTIDGNQILQTTSSDLATWLGSGPVVLQAGNFDGWVQDLVVRSIPDTAPTVPPPKLTSLANNSDGLYQFTIQGAAGVPYSIEASTNLDFWTPVYTNFFGGFIQFIDTQSVNFPSRFYRAHALDHTPSLSALPPTPDGNTQLQVNENYGLPYTIDASLDSTNWVSLYTNSSGGPMVFTDKNSTNYPAIYYRAAVANLQPVFTSSSLDSSGCYFLHTESIPDAAYIIQTSTDLLNWTPVSTNQFGGPLDFWDYDAVNYPNRFYRVLIQTIGVRGYH